MHVTVRTPSGNTKRVKAPSHVTRQMISNMTELTQLQMFGGVAMARPLPTSIRGRVMASENRKEV